MLSSAFYKLVGYKFGRITCMITGFIGVPIHEIGHALFCLIFGHKVTEIKLYQPNSKDGTLGYVNHSWNPNNLYHNIGNFFIGFAPILFGSAIILLLMLSLAPNLFEALLGSSAQFSVKDINIFSFSILIQFFEMAREGILVFYSNSQINTWQWWIFMLPALSVALHMSLSTADIKGCFTGFKFIVLALLIVNTILSITNKEAVEALSNHSLVVGAFILNFLVISLLFSVMLFLFGIVVWIIRNFTKL
jgi:hypothetical protein